MPEAWLPGPQPRFCSGSRKDGRRCGRRIFDIDDDALKPGKVLRLKCSSCNHMNTFVGTPAPPAAPVQLREAA